MKKGLITLCSIIFTIYTQAQLTPHLAQKEVFSLGYPHFLSFRGEMVNRDHASYEAWKSSIENTAGYAKKLVNEELVLKPNEETVRAWANTYSAETPSKLTLLHFNGQARMPDIPFAHSLYFPGHWVYEAGTVLTSDCSETDTVIKVASTDPFSENAYKLISKPSGHYVLMLKLDENGNKLWDQSEVVQVTQVNKAENELTITRNNDLEPKINTKPSLSFQNTKTYLAPISGMVINNRVMWFYNLSTYCPKDENNNTAADVLVNELSGYFEEDGPLDNLDGIAFDVNYFEWQSHFGEADVNNDGIIDNGWLLNENNVLQNSWSIGDYSFLTNLRNRLGDDIIITSDGHHDDSQRAVNVLNGLESEGLVQHNDAWRGFSRTVNSHLYWKSNTTRTYFSYVANKFLNEDDALNSDRLDRFVTATASALGAFVFNDINQSVFPEWMQAPNALGNQVGQLTRYAKLFPNVQTLSNSEIITDLKSDDCDIQLVDGNIKVTNLPSNSANKDMEFKWSNINLPGGDLTIFIEVQSIDPLEGMTHDDFVPRNFYTELSNLPDYGESNQANSYHRNLYGLFGTHKTEELSFYFRRPNVEAGSQTLSFKVQGKGDFIIKSVKIYNKADILIQEFENGVVIINPSLNDTLIDVDKVTSLSFTEQEILVASVDARFISKNLSDDNNNPETLVTPIKKKRK